MTQSSAGFLGKTAEKILNVDHSGVCKFETPFGGYMQLLDKVKKIREELLSTTVYRGNCLESVPSTVDG